MKKIYILFFITLSVFVFSCARSSNTVVIGTKNYTENIILGVLMQQIIEAKTDIKVIMKSNLGNTFVVFEAIKQGSIDMYPDYTGTLYQANLKQTSKLNIEDTYSFVKKEMKARFDLEVLSPFGFNNTYALGMKKEVAKKYNIKKISDLVQYPKLRYAFDNEFAGRSDGADQMLEFYGIVLDKRYLVVDIGLRYQTIVEDQADITDAFSTDTQIKRFDLVTLEDDKNFFPPYYALPIIRADTLAKYPKVQDALLLLENILTEEGIMDLTYQVEEFRKKPSEVVDALLRKKNIK